jgi:salicylate hydroxylase
MVGENSGRELTAVEDSGQAAYRVMVRRALVKDDPELIPFFKTKQSWRWIGEGRHIMVGRCVRLS